MSPLVSVVVPAYNNADYIDATVQSVLAQTCTDLELVIADHSSTDGTWERLQQYADHPAVRLTRTSPGGGAQRNWNAVSQAAEGTYVKLVCGDDLVHLEALARQVDALERAGERCVLAAAQRDMVDARGQVFLRARGLAGLDGVVDGAAALRATVRAGGNIFGEPASVLMRRSALEAAGWWADSQYFIDVATYAGVLVQGDMVAIREPLASFRVSQGQWSVRLVNDQARQATEFFRTAQRLAPTITDGDIRLGTARAVALSVQRRAVYTLLGRRMRPAESPTVGAGMG
ncbi:MAG TPA: glycosyltransferase family A protein [Cellulomonas sp.]